MDQTQTGQTEVANTTSPQTVPTTPPAVTHNPTATAQTVVPSAQQGTSGDVRTIVTVLALIFAYPVGVILAWVWSRWRLWVKLLVTLPPLLFFILIFLASLLVALNPSAQFERADFMQECTNTKTVQECAQEYLNNRLEDSRVPTLIDTEQE